MMKEAKIFTVLLSIIFAMVSSVAANDGYGKVLEIKKAKIFVMFRGSGPAREASELKYNDRERERKIMTNHEIMAELEKHCPNVEFAGDTSPFLYDQVGIGRLDNLPVDADGIVIFGHMGGHGHAYGGPLADKMTGTGLPIIVVYPMWGMWQSHFSYQGYKDKKILTAHISVFRDRSDVVFSARFDDLANKINIIKGLSELKGFRILSITDEPPLGHFTPRYGNPGQYEKVFLDNLHNIFGVELLVIPQEELFDKIQEICNSEDGEAERIAEKWIEESEKVYWEEVTRDDIVRSARTYMAMKSLRHKYHCHTVTTEGYSEFARFEKGPIPCQGLAATHLCTEGSFAATSECLIYSLIAQQLGFNITGRKGFNGDYMIDVFNNVAYVMHCEGPLDPFGDREKCPYHIRELPQHYKNQCGAVAQIKYPLNEPVTVIGLGIHDKKMSIFTGRTVCGESIFEDINDYYCRSKITIRTDAESLLENVNWEATRNHKVVFFGDYRDEFKNLAKIIGFEVIETDKRQRL